MPAVAWKQPYAGLSPQAAPVSLEFVEQLWAEQNITVFATFTALDVNHHALAVHVADLQVCQFSASYSGGVERHQQSAMVGSERRINESRDFFLAQDRRKVKCSFRIRSLGDAPGFLERLDVEEPQSRQTLRNRARR